MQPQFHAASGSAFIVGKRSLGMRLKRRRVEQAVTEAGGTVCMLSILSGMSPR